MSEKTPQAGEFWEWAGERLRIIGTRNDGRIVGENQAGGLEMSCHIFDMTHLPDCDSFDWQPETFPQWYEPLLDVNAAYGIRTNKTELIVVHHDGRRVVRTWEPIDDHRKKITQSEAESRIKKPEPVESPDDWVTQDRVPDRPGVDQWMRTWEGRPTDWEPSQKNEERYMHGHVCTETGSIFQVRCRRRDLPKPEAKREYVRLWYRSASGPLRVTTGETLDGTIWSELKHDGTGFYLEDGK